MFRSSALLDLTGCMNHASRTSSPAPTGNWCQLGAQDALREAASRAQRP